MFLLEEFVRIKKDVSATTKNQQVRANENYDSSKNARVSVKISLHNMMLNYSTKPVYSRRGYGGSATD